jgi:hypothetical protein
MEVLSFLVQPSCDIFSDIFPVVIVDVLSFLVLTLLREKPLSSELRTLDLHFKSLEVWLFCAIRIPFSRK